ncbi:MAG: hypothetical protein KDK59_02035 [Simkania sp.]|nr:hypothetical protein [Simkania sp.]
MDSTKPSSSAQKNSFTNYFPPIKDVATRAAAYSASSLLMGRINPVALVISTFNAATVSFASQFVQEEENHLKKMIIGVVSLAAATLIVAQAAPALAMHADLALTQDFVYKLGLFNVFGEAILFLVPYIASWDAPKLPASPKELKDLTEKNLLHMRNHFENFKKMTPEVFAAFVEKLQDLKQEDLLPKPPKTLEDIKKLDAFGVRYAYEYLDDHMEDEIVSLDEEAPLWEALYTRFIEEGLPLPVDDFDRHSKKTLLHIRDNFENYKMNTSVFNEFANRLAKLQQEDLFPKPPKAVEDIQKLDAFSVRCVYEDSDSTMLSEITRIKKSEDQAPLWDALYTRFFEQKLPLRVDDVENLTEKMLRHIHANFQDFTAMDHAAFEELVDELENLDKALAPKAPATIEDIQKLDAYALRYANVFPDSMTAKFGKTPENNPLYEALHLCFFQHDLPLPNRDTIANINAEKRPYYRIKIDPKPSIEDIEAFSANQLSWLYCHFATDGDFKAYSLEEQVKINALFLKKFNRYFYYARASTEEIKTLSDSAAKSLFDHFSSHPDGIYQFIRYFTMAEKEAFNERFKTVEGYKDALHTIYTPLKLLDIQKLKDGSNWYTYFRKNPEQWAKLDKPCQEAFNHVFTTGTYKYTPIAITY